MFERGKGIINSGTGAEEQRRNETEGDRDIENLVHQLEYDQKYDILVE